MDKAYVDCILGARLIATYEFGLPRALGPTLAPTDEQLIQEAKLNLSNEHKAQPPFVGIDFRVRRRA
jgi:hypothetical protein